MRDDRNLEARSTSEARSEEFTIKDLGRVRGLVAEAARLAGLTVTIADNLVTAVNEIAINAILYAGGRGRVRIASWPRGICVEISDNGPGLPTGLATDRPGIDATGGRGLWLARRLCQRMNISSTSRGVRVSMVAARA